MMVTNDYSFPEFDTSYWKIRDKTWMDGRKAVWPQIEGMLCSSKSGKGKTAIKKYFLKGELPDWNKFRAYDNSERHLDLFMMLWLHPSWDKQLLLKLRDDYINSVVIRIEDIEVGYSNFFMASIVLPSQDYSDLPEEERVEELSYGIDTRGNNELLFDLLTQGLDRAYYDLQFLYLDGHSPETRRFYPVKSFGFDYLNLMGFWLCIKKIFFESSTTRGS